jgi:Holliday junction DNA helicase RuvA
MIASLTGKVVASATKRITLSVMGIGFDVIVAQENLFLIGSESTLFIYFYWSQEAGPQLYGFLRQSEKMLFDLVLSCAGCGPKIGLAVVASIEPALFVAAIAQADTGVLSSINGIGKKKAEQMVLSLKDKIKETIYFESFVAESPAIAQLKKLDDVLISLSYSRQECSSALDYLKKHANLETDPFDYLLRKALAWLSKLSK